MKSNINWDKADWTKQDVELSVTYGVSRERVRQVRAEKGKSNPARYRRRVEVTAGDRIAAMDTEGKTVIEVAKAAGCGIGFARATMKRNRKDYKRMPKGNARYDWTLVPSNWEELTDKVIAGMVGASSPAIVTQWRVRHNMRKRG